jgi:glycogen(starch) synthase
VRVLHLSWEYPPVLIGGLGRHVHALAETQARQGDDVVVITQGEPGAAPDEVVNGVRIIRVERDAPEIPDWRTRFIEWTFGFNVAVARAGMALAREWRPDVVHAHDWLVGQAAVLLCEARDLPLVLTMHATENGRMGGVLVTDQSRAIDSTEEWSVEHADRVIVCSAYMRDEVCALFGVDEGRVDVIPNGIEAADWTTTAARRRAMRRRFGSPLIAYAGRLEAEKGVQTLIDALPLVRREAPAARLVVVGTGGAERDLRARARRRRVADAVTFTGYVSDEDLRAVLAAADVAVVPSLYEPFGFVALEAMALGTPLVAARTGGLAEIVEEGRTGRTFAAGDPAELAAVLLDSLAHPRRARAVAATARAELEARYGWPAIADVTAGVYRSVTRAR